MSPIKTAVVTGASRGLGRAFARRLLAEGVTVIGLSRDPAAAQPLEGVEWRQLDLASPAALETFAPGEVDLLINNAGFADAGRCEGFSGDDVRRHLQVMLESPIALTRAVLPGMRRRGAGTIVNVASLAVELPIPYLSLYNTAKAGLAGFSRGLMLELAGTGVQVLDFRPGDFKTAFFAGSRCLGDGSDASLQTAWTQMRAQVEKGPLPARAADDLWRALARGRSGTVRTGSWFQASLAAWAARHVPDAWMRSWIRRYYGLKPA